ncbi:MAG: TetR family transcriptional regulator, partial [Proteobacteria bacterium]
LPDTGNLRDDLLALVKPYSQKHAERKLRVMEGLGSFYTAHKKVADEVFCGIFGAWNTTNRALLNRAIERREIAKTAPVEMVCETIIAMASHYKRTQQKGFDRAAYAVLLDSVLMPALKK